MTLLEAVNLILPKLGERRVTNLDANHPTLAVILPEIDLVQRAVLLKGWWFNEFEYMANPNPQKEITLGTDTLRFTPIDGQEAALRGLRLYNPQTLDFKWDAGVKGVVTNYVVYDELPESAQLHILYAACVNVYVADIGVTSDVQIWQTLAGAAYSDLLAEHLRQRRHSTRRSRRFHRIRAALVG